MTTPQTPRTATLASARLRACRRLVITKCPACEIEFEGTTNKKYCCNACAQYAKRRRKLGLPEKRV